MGAVPGILHPRSERTHKCDVRFRVWRLQSESAARCWPSVVSYPDVGIKWAFLCRVIANELSLRAPPVSLPPNYESLGVGTGPTQISTRTHEHLRPAPVAPPPSDHSG